jgi:hypothetical protein
MLQEDNYSRLIKITKITLPGIALIILSVLFLLPDKRTTIQAFDNIDKSLLKIVQKAGIDKPSFRGTLASGSNLELYANEIVPKDKNNNLIEINEITARLELDPKIVATAYAKKGVINIEKQTAEMVGKVNVEGFNDITVEASDLKVFYDKAIAKTHQPVLMLGNFGMIRAGAAEFSDKSQKSDIGYVLLFSDGVKMLYNMGND